MHSPPRPFAISIAGFDPSGGAGMLADVKTFENLGVYGMGALTALTHQNDREFTSVRWQDVAEITGQLDLLLARFEVTHFKLGILPHWEALRQVLDYLYERVEKPIIVLDPVLKASAGYELQQDGMPQLLEQLHRVYCITPNMPEAQKILNTNELNDVLEQLSEVTNIYLKGGHAEGGTAVDLLYTADHTFAYTNDRLAKGAKHGSGCVLSAALTAGLALGLELPDAAELANLYTHQFLASNETLLGYHLPFSYASDK